MAEVSKPHSIREEVTKARDLAGYGSAPMYDHHLYALADALDEADETIRGFEGVVRNLEENERRLVEQFDASQKIVEQQDELLMRQDAVIEVMTHYMDDLLDRARALRVSEYPRHEAGVYVMYAKTRLEELVAKVAAVNPLPDDG